MNEPETTSDETAPSSESESGSQSASESESASSSLPRTRVAGKLVTAILFVVISAVSVTALAGLYAAVVWLRLPSTAGLGDSGDPGATAFMAESGCGDTILRTYRPLDQIDPRLGCAIVWAEDFRFFVHDGFDLRGFASAMRSNWALGDLRFGGSTIPMQLARNLYLERGRTPTRKFREILLARELARDHDRLRLLELYLNAAEWAPCVYGAEAGAQHHLGRSAADLSVAEAVFLASLLPRPSKPPGHDAADRGRLQFRQQELVGHMTRAGLLSGREERDARAGVVALWRDREAEAPAGARHAAPPDDRAVRSTGQDRPSTAPGSHAIPVWYREQCMPSASRNASHD